MKKDFLKNMFVLNDLSNKEKLALAITVLILLVIVMNVIYSFNEKEVIFNYEQFNVSEAINISSEINDRQTILDLTQIVNNMLYSYNLNINAYDGYINYDNINYNLEDYYYALHIDYEKSIDKDQYLDIACKMCDKFIVMGRYGEYVQLDGNILKNVYLLPEEMYGSNSYVCSLNTKVFNTTSYIGIKLNKDTSKYSIFYLE